MEHKIIQKEKNPFFSREEFKIELTCENNPTEESIIEITGKDKDLTIVKKVANNFGKNTFIADVLTYDSKEAKDKVETIPKKIRKKMEEEKKAEEEAAAKKVEEEKKAAEGQPLEKLDQTESTNDSAPVEETPVENAETPVEEPKAEEKTEEVKEEKKE